MDGGEPTRGMEDGTKPVNALNRCIFVASRLIRLVLVISLALSIVGNGIIMSETSEHERLTPLGQTFFVISSLGFIFAGFILLLVQLEVERVMKYVRFLDFWAVRSFVQLFIGMNTLTQMQALSSMHVSVGIAADTIVQAVGWSIVVASLLQLLMSCAGLRRFDHLGKGPKDVKGAAQMKAARPASPTNTKRKPLIANDSLAHQQPRHDAVLADTHDRPSDLFRATSADSELGRFGGGGAARKGTGADDAADAAYPYARPAPAARGGGPRARAGSGPGLGDRTSSGPAAAEKLASGGDKKADQKGGSDAASDDDERDESAAAVARRAAARDDDISRRREAEDDELEKLYAKAQGKNKSFDPAD